MGSSIKSENLLIIALVILSIIMISVILLQPDRSQGLAKSSANILDEEKEGIEKFTEIVATLFLVVAILFQIVR